MDLAKIQNYLREQRKKAEESSLPLKSVRVIDLEPWSPLPSPRPCSGTTERK